MITAIGKITTEGRLILPQDLQLMEYLNKNKGKTVILTVDAYTPGDSKAQEGYYRKVILPVMQEAFTNAGERMTIKDTEEKILHLSPVTYDGNTYKKWEDLNTTQKSRFISDIKQIAAEELFTFIPDPY
jgi:hypothetical protein